MNEVARGTLQQEKMHPPLRKREGGGRIDIGSERRGGEVDKKRKKKTRGKFKGGGGKNKTRSRNLRKTPKLKLVVS